MTWKHRYRAIDMSHIDELRELLKLKKKRLYELRKKEAVLGFSADPSLAIEIETIEAEIYKFEFELQQIERGEPPPVSLVKDRLLYPSDPTPEPPFGTMSPQSRFYIERQVDTVCWRHISSAYAMTIFIQAPRQVGKSSLMLKMLDQAEKRIDKRSVFIDFQEFPKEHFVNEEDFLIELCLMMSRALGIKEAINDYWQGRANIVKCGFYLEQYLLPKVTKSFILAMDEVDRVFASPFRDNFFGMLRSWHNKRASNSQFEKMSLFLSSATEALELVEGYDQSPFNVADYLSLQDFTTAEVADLNRRYGSPLVPIQVEQLRVLTGGHPFLTRLAFHRLITEKVSVDTLFSETIINSKPFESHMQYYLRYIFDNAEIKEAMLAICRDETYEENDHFYRLKGAGLIKKVGRRVVPRNQLYARYFEARLQE